MLKTFSTKQLIFAALMGALMFVLSFVLGSGLNVATGNPAASGLVSTLIQSLLLTIAVIITKRFGIGTMMYLIYGILAIPTNMLGGLPGPLKVALAICIGLIFDSVVYFCRYKKWGWYLGFVIMYIFLVPANLYIYSVLGLPNAEILFKYAPYLFTIFLIESFIGVWLGFKVHNKIKNKSIIKQISS